ncbi:type III PLP-dependent enzyme [Actinoplanes sp. NBRC 103695]|uniref:type III PLP-dependent enzyme n=1 Tax=Actinoplanes sp. NBRC 103695 TaxID=3032202 RepID=UPI0024A4AF7B|nr:type III PLP-dependent enzyme [Actinoplanes sp. NBRC 103695]GLY94242.1 ornithine decarboxylase [Actinoplanes sp. NBRC 103695]
MTPALLTPARVPAHWPSALAPDVLEVIDMPTPYLVTDLGTVAARHEEFERELPGVRAYYAMKSNPAQEVLATLAARGSGFEIASLGELRMLERAGVDPADVLYSNPVKPPAHVAEAYRAGLWRFSFDSPGELAKIAELAPGAAVYVRLRVDDEASVFPLSRKFGTSVGEAYDLLTLAERLGLRAYGITFHVGSQCANPLAWRQAIADSARLMNLLRADGIELRMLNLGGGFPARYVNGVPSIETIGAVVTAAQDELLPYRPELLAAEPGRYLVAESAVLATTVIGRERRDDENWLFVDVSAYHGLMETLQTANGWEYPLWTSVRHAAEIPGMRFTVTGPSCDSSDTVFTGVTLPATIDVGDILYIGSAGAYTLSYASAFNGFPPPTPLFVGGGADGR